MAPSGEDVVAAPAPSEAASNLSIITVNKPAAVFGMIHASAYTQPFRVPQPFGVPQSVSNMSVIKRMVHASAYAQPPSAAQLVGFNTQGVTTFMMQASSYLPPPHPRAAAVVYSDISRDFDVCIPCYTRDPGRYSALQGISDWSERGRIAEQVKCDVCNTRFGERSDILKTAIALKAAGVGMESISQVTAVSDLLYCMFITVQLTYIH